MAGRLHRTLSLLALSLMANCSANDIYFQQQLSTASHHDTMGVLPWIYSHPGTHHIPSRLDQLLANQATSPATFARYFNCCGMTAAQILEHPRFYMHNGFAAFAQQFPGYRAYIAQQAHYYHSLTKTQRFLGTMTGAYQSGLADRFDHLHRTYETAIVRQEIERQAAHQREVAARDTAQKRRAQELQQFCVAYCEELHGIERAILARGMETPCDMARMQAIREACVNPMARVVKQVPCDARTIACAAMYGIAAPDLHGGSMNAYEHALQTEFVDQLGQIDTLRMAQLPGSKAAAFLDIVGHEASLGIEANVTHQPAAATYWADVAWETLDIAKAIGEGVGLGLRNLVHNVKDVVRGGACLARVVADKVLHPLDTIHTAIAGVDRVMDLCMRGLDQAARCRDWGELKDTFQLKQKCELLRHELESIAQQCTQKIATMPPREMVKYTTAFATEIMVPAKIFKAIQLMCAGLQPIVQQGLCAARAALHREQCMVEIAGLGTTIDLGL